MLQALCFFFLLRQTKKSYDEENTLLKIDENLLLNMKQRKV